jgi:hypothetical protein
MGIGRVLIPNLVEKMYLVPWQEYPSSNAVDRCVTPTLDACQYACIVDEAHVYLVVEPACGFEVLEEGGIRRPAPEIHVRNFEITPDCIKSVKVSKFDWSKRPTHNDRGCTCCPHPKT